MTIKEIADLTKMYIALENINETLLLEVSKQSVTDIATRFFPQLHREEIFTESTKIFLSTLEKNPLEILSVKHNHKKIPFKAYPTFINIKTDLIESLQWFNGKNGLKISVEYSFLPKIVDETTEIEMPLPPKVFALLAASDYLFINGLFAESLAFEKKFNQAIAILKKPQNTTLPKTSLFE